jgi:hypothetical protein
LEAEKAKEKQKEGTKVVWELNREGFPSGGARVCAKKSRGMIPRYLPTVNGYL